ncbi:hypothetical protein OHB35_15175 [Streptomyces phaeochromogenes]|uniref:REase associating with pPIWI RE domain-containing protein n=1 Tax=Streptomyces phaeochromogenes TaxID=1923 RepID=A0ABZ1H7D7_STRPH|nr:hypothetical protein [Streptomyces phaeochromogenes]WSD14474.1 hypothetical protein OHB35_15175 [Streptomyces phaeochromogenes]
MDRRDYLGQSMMQAAVLPARAAYLIRTGSRTGFRRAVQEASTRWGGMTEPILAVPDDGEIPDELRETVAAAKVEAAVNVDVDDALAQRAADALGLPYVRIAKIDHVGAARFTCHPLHVNPPVQPSTLPVVAVDGAPLWQVAAAGFLSEDQAEELRPTVLAVRPGLPDEYGRNQMYGATHLQSTIAQFGEYRSNAIGSLPAVVWVTDPDDIEDCIAFWNSRALRPVSHAGMPMLLLPTGEVQHWLGLAQQLAGMLARPAEFSPDVMLLSRNVPQEHLHEIAEILELQRTDAEVKISEKFPTPGLRQPAFTYRTGLDPRSWLLRDREYGLSTSFDVHVFAGDTSTLRFTSPVHFHTQGSWALVRLWGSPLDGLPRRDCVALLVEANAQWRRDSIQLRTRAQNDCIFGLTVPTLAQATEAVLGQASARHALSDKGKLGVALQTQADIAALLEPGVYEAVIALTTPRSKELLRELRKIKAEGTDDAAQLVELASTWGGRAERRYRPITKLELPPQRASEAAERLCELGWAERGVETNCAQCGVRTFHPFEQTQRRPVCPGCSSPSRYETTADGLSVFYRLDSFVDRASDQGLLPHLLVIAALTKKEPNSYFLPGIDLWFTDQTHGEADVFGLYGGRVLSGEVKTSASQFTNEQLTHDIALSTRLGVDIHLLAAVDTVPQTIREQTAKLCSDAGLDLLVLDKSELRRS